ncbi:MAG: alpha-amylase [Chloroflexi bacterium]|nr:alpha-amylase [Chloroflexota bacterium]
MILILSACTGAQEPVTAVSVTSPNWWNDAIFYEIFVRSYYDSNSDGNGDINGLIEKLDYLNDGDPTTDSDLGITAIWLMPITEAASYHGYDTLDYTTIEEDYGSNSQFQRLIEEAHKRGIRVIVDLVINHTSDRHPWFQNSISSPDAEKRDWYIWIDENPTHFGSWGQIVWHQYGAAHYFGLFTPQMPDLNITNPDVTAEIHTVTRFWIEEVGVDGFRIDAARHLIEDGEQMSNTPETRAWLIDFNQTLHDTNDDAVTVGEIWDESYAVAPYVQDGAVDLAFEFNLAEMIIYSINQQNPSALHSRLEEVFKRYPAGQYATFLTNHDMNRVMTQLDKSDDQPHRAYLAASTLLTLPGVPFIYYGEEIGMVGNRGLLTPRDEFVRTPMQWSPEEHGGFSRVQPWLNENSDLFSVNVELAEIEEDSLLNHYKQMIRLRQTHVALRRGGTTLLGSSCSRVLAYLRHYADDANFEEDVVLVFHNFSPDAFTDCEYSLPQSSLGSDSYRVVDLLTGDEVATAVITNGTFTDLTFHSRHAPHSTHILQLIPE